MFNSDLWIRHALNQGEYHIPGTRYHCDGYCPETNTVYEFLGCHWHGCKTCYPRDRHTISIPGTDKTAVELFTWTKIREKAIRDKGYGYVSIWEHAFRDKLAKDPTMKTAINSLDLVDPIDPRDSFFRRADQCHPVALQSETGKLRDFQPGVWRLADGTIRPKIEECKRYIELYFENEGIRLDWDLVKKNPCLRSLAKLCLNSLWGKLGQRGNLPRSTFFFKDQLDDFYQLLTDATKEVRNLNIMGDDAVHVSYKDTSEFVPVSTNTNICLSLHPGLA
ncbi:hypothetical protein FSP39_016671 [Pinctada imbricata]|uniref:DNA-directed DNA polymerase n=1 Tax=Pinctada imbricata TaxID=66713 RepID=A0AA88YKR9_PINIB|nr:hypothetical protein FSP39_016671 [Pinctada imbricata]